MLSCPKLELFTVSSMPGPLWYSPCRHRTRRRRLPSALSADMMSVRAVYSSPRVDAHETRIGRVSERRTLQLTVCLSAPVVCL